MSQWRSFRELICGSETPGPKLEAELSDAVKAFNSGQYTHALEFLSASVSANGPLDPPFELLRGECLVKLARVSDARRVFQKLIDSNQEYYGFVGLGKIAFAEEDFGLALEMYHRAEDFSPEHSVDDAFIRVEMAHCKYALREYESVIEICDQALEAEPSQLGAWQLTLLAQAALRRTSQFDETVDRARKRLDDSSVRSIEKLARELRASWPKPRG